MTASEWRTTAVARRRIRAFATIAIAVAALAGASAAQAATWTVTTTADTTLGNGNCLPSSCSLRQAIKASAAGDTVVVPASATPYAVANGNLIVLHMLTIKGAGSASTVIQSTGASRVMLVTGNTGPVTLQDLTITGGDATSVAGGGGIEATGPGDLVLDGVVVTGNKADSTSAGAGFNEGGGGIYSVASVVLNGSTVSGNTATVPASAGDGGGGGILMAQTSDNSDSLTLRGSTITHNTANVTADGSSTTDANGGGGIYEDGSDLTIVGSMITDNVASIATSPVNTSTPTDGGGGIFQFGNRLLLQDSTVSGNVAHGPGIDKSGGGGILDNGNQSGYVNSTITGNSTDEPASTGIDAHSDGGGGLLLNNVKDGVTIANTTINGNSASAATGGGINNEISTTVEVTDSIIAGNTSGDSNGNCAGPILSFGYNLTNDPSTANTCSLTASGDVLGANPELGSLADNGGGVTTESLLSGSPARGAGDPVGCTDLLGTTLTTDERGAVRPQAPAHCDIGAYQVAAPTATTGTAQVDSTSVVLSGTAGEPDPRAGQVSFQYGPDLNYGHSTATQALAGGASTTPFAATLSGLAPGTYHFRIVATNPDATTTGNDGVFTVPAPAAAAAPSVTTDRPVAVGAYAATLLGAVDPSGQTTTYHFEYGLIGSKRRFQSHDETVYPGRSAAVTASIAGLRPRSRYTVTLVATNAGGTTSGDTVAFRTRSRRRPAGLTAVVRPRWRKSRPYSYSVHGRLLLPGGASRALGCKGTIKVSVIAWHRRLIDTSVPIGSSCRYTARFTLGSRLLASVGHARVYVLFGGNAEVARLRVPERAIRFGG